MFKSDCIIILELKDGYKIKAVGYSERFEELPRHAKLDDADIKYIIKNFKFQKLLNHFQLEIYMLLFYFKLFTMIYEIKRINLKNYTWSELMIKLL